LPGPHNWTTTRNSSSFGNPNADLLDAKSNGTFDPGDGTLVEIIDDAQGNYQVFRGLSGPVFRAEIRGDGVTHLGPAGIQIAKAARARVPIVLTDFIHDKLQNQVTLTWKSFPGDQYGIYWSADLDEFVPTINPAVPAHASSPLTTYGPFTSPVPGAGRMFFQVGPPDLKPPTLARVWGDNSTVSLTFSEHHQRQPRPRHHRHHVRPGVRLWLGRRRA
jgi:hypothetical protein